MTGPEKVDKASLFRVTTEKAYTEGKQKFSGVKVGNDPSKQVPEDPAIEIQSTEIKKRKASQQSAVKHDVLVVLERFAKKDASTLDKNDIPLILKDLQLDENTKEPPKDFAQKILQHNKIPSELKQQLIELYKAELDLRGYETKIAVKIIEIMNKKKADGHAYLDADSAQKLFAALTEKSTLDDLKNKTKTEVNQKIREIINDSTNDGAVQLYLNVSLNKLVSEAIKELKTQISDADQKFTLNWENKEAMLQIFKDPEIATLLASIQRGDDKLIAKSSFRVDDKFIDSLFTEQWFQEFMLDFGSKLIDSPDFQKLMTKGLDPSGQIRAETYKKAKELVMKQFNELITNIKTHVGLSSKDLKALKTEDDIADKLKDKNLTDAEFKFVKALLTAKSKGMFAVRSLFKGFLYRIFSGTTMAIKSGSLAYTLAIGIVTIVGFVVANIALAGIPLYITLAGVGTFALAGFITGFYRKHKYSRAESIEKSKLTAKEKKQKTMKRLKKKLIKATSEENIGKAAVKVAEVIPSLEKAGGFLKK